MTSSMPVDVGSFTKEQFAEWFDSFDVVLCDCDGKMNFSPEIHGICYRFSF